MESICVGGFLFIFLAIAALIAAPIAVAIGVVVRRHQNDVPSNEHRPDAVVIGLVSFVLLMILACIALLAWNPEI